MMRFSMLQYRVAPVHAFGLSASATAAAAAAGGKVMRQH